MSSSPVAYRIYSSPFKVEMRISSCPYKWHWWRERAKWRETRSPQAEAVLSLWACNCTEAYKDKWEDIKGAVASCQDHKGLQWLCQRPLRTGQKLEGERKMSVRAHRVIFTFFLLLLFLKMKDRVLFVVSKGWTEWLHGTEIMFTNPKSHQCHHKSVKKNKTKKKWGGREGNEYF